MRQAIHPSLQFHIEDPHVTPAGLVVPGKSVDTLVKAEAAKLEKEKNKGAFFSKYQMFANMSAWGAREKPQGTPSFDILYEASKKSFIDAILIRARIDQQKMVWQRALTGKQVGFKVVHDRHDDKTFKGSKDIDERCREMEELLADPTPSQYIDIFPHNIRPHTRLKDLVAVLTKAELIIDRKVIRRYKRRDGKGYAAFHWLPGRSIKNVDESVREWARKNETNGQVNRNTIEKMSYDTGIDIARCAYIQMFDGMVTDGFMDDEISVHISNPSDEENRWGYGESRLELSLDVTTTLLMAWRYNKEMFKTNYPEQILAVIGDYDKEGLAAFKQQVLGETGQGGNWRLPVIPFNSKEEAELKSVKLRESPKDMLFDNLLRLMCMFKCAAYGAHPSTVNLVMDSGSGGTPLGGHSPGAEIEFSKEQGLIPSLMDLCEWFTDSIVKPRYEDLRVILVGLEPEDEKQAIEIRGSRTSKWLTRNEARMEEGLKPVGDINDLKNPWNYPADVAITNYINTFNMVGDDENPDEETEEDDKGEQKGINRAKNLKGKEGKDEEDIEKSQKDKKFLRITLED